jgi:hypothetical protein
LRHHQGRLFIIVLATLLDKVSFFSPFLAIVACLVAELGAVVALVIMGHATACTLALVTGVVTAAPLVPALLA